MRAARALARLALLATLPAIPVAGLAARKAQDRGLVWTHPEFSSFGIDRIAMLPAASFDQNNQAERMVEEQLARALRESGYRWVSSTSVKALLRSGRDGDSLLKVMRDGLLERPRVDSLVAPLLCARLRCDALLSVRVDGWRQVRLEDYQTGQPSTTVALKAALVDSLGRLLWSASGEETAEGPYQNPTRDPRAAPTGGGLSPRVIDATRGAPGFEPTLSALLTRWAGRFPPRAPAPAGGE